MQCLIASLGPRMAEHAPEVVFHPRKSIFRIYRDVRFSNNKAPYRPISRPASSCREKKSPTESPGSPGDRAG